MYVHEVSIYKNLLDAVLSNWDTNVRPSHQGEIVRCLMSYIRANYEKKYVQKIYGANLQKDSLVSLKKC